LPFKCNLQRYITTWSANVAEANAAREMLTKAVFWFLKRAAAAALSQWIEWTAW
jgi:hypothetical protein